MSVFDLGLDLGLMMHFIQIHYFYATASSFKSNAIVFKLRLNPSISETTIVHKLH